MATATNIYARLTEIQQALKAPKNQYNSFGKYHYRSCEDILEAVKPLLNGLSLHIYDEIVLIGDRYYVKATSELSDGKDKICSTAYAREEATKKGMDASQITGSASSYSRKYSLNGLFLIDDTKDADTRDNTEEKQPPKKTAPLKAVPTKEDITEEKERFNKNCAELAMSDGEITALKKFIFKKSPTKAELKAVNDDFSTHFDAFVDSTKGAVE